MPSGASPELFLDFARRLQPRIEARLKLRLAAELRRMRRLGPEAFEACHAFTETCLRGGKRLRAALVFAGGHAFGTALDPRLLLDVAAAVEVLHMYLLVHDDWMDGDLVRRAGPSVHARLRQSFGTGIGDSAAILAGDWGAAVAQSWMAQAPIAPARLTRVLTQFAAMQDAAIGGQLRDVLASDERIELTYQLKTASYTVQGPLALGALVSGAGARQLGWIAKFAAPAGIAFQLRDDLMSLFGTPRQTGKPFGSDLRAGKRTAVVLHALAAASGSDAKNIKRAFGNGRATVSELRAAVRSIEKLGSHSFVEQRIAGLVAQACRQLQRPGIPEAARELLTSAAVALAVRTQ